ncbi:acyl-CoA-binding protein [Flavobacterium sp.]|jgi:acyl-CoA-binding protein|uniref:acyl-CoA-binding protein n=1 Tax=Flavobacterium sp. TaxID=239 RepID=UPI0037C18097
MSQLSLDERFKEAIQNANEKIPKTSVPQDVQLVLYAYYKQALSGNISYSHHGYESDEVITAFKQNAWMQVRHLTANEAKEKYIEIINQMLKDRQ